MNEIFSNDVTSSESNWKNTPQCLKDWKKHPRPSSKLFVSSKNHISKSANVSITISSYIMYIIFRVLRSTSPNFEPSIWDSFSSAVPTVPTFLLHYHDPCLGIKRHIQFFSRPSLGSWQPSQCGDTEDHISLKPKDQLFDCQMGVRIFHTATGAPPRLSDCACAWYTLRGSLERTCHCEKRMTLRRMATPSFWNSKDVRLTLHQHGWCFFGMSWSRASQYLIRKEHGDLHLKCNKELLPIVSN